MSEIKEFIEKIIPAIEKIDGGCSVCVGNFCDRINDTIKDYSLELTYTEDYEIRVTIKEIKQLNK